MGEVLPVLDAIRARRSVRNFLGPLPADKHGVVERAIAEALALPRPFGTNVEIASHPPGLGRLGMISNDAGWLIGKVPADAADTRVAHIDVAFVLHEALIRLEQHGIATVWIAGTFSPAVAERSAPGFRVPAAIAYGLDAGRPGLGARLASWMSGSRARLPFAQLFFDRASGQPFTEDTAGDWAGLLGAVQAGPSAVNRQPWRLGIAGNAVHVYNAGTQAMALLDIGIALAGIQLWAGAVGKAVAFSVVDEPPPMPLGGVYVVTATING
jgi:nitroreductase